jgi:HSP20 family protein
MLVKVNQNPFAVIDRMLDDTLRNNFSSFTESFNANAMKVDISEDEKSLYITAELPGLKKEDVKISIEDNLLTIRAERKKETEEKQKNYQRVERFYGSFSRSFNLGDNVGTDAIEAEYKEGVLHLTLPKIEPVKNTKEVVIK